SLRCSRKRSAGSRTRRRSPACSISVVVQAMPSILITGANRGIGLEFARQYAADGWDVIAAARHSSPELDALGVTVKSLDLADADAVAAFTVDRPLDLFIANAGT